MRSESNNITRLTIDLPSEMHRLIKAKASLQNLSIKDFVIRAIENDVDKVPVEKRQLNEKTISILRQSMKNSHKKKSFNSSQDAMEWLLPTKKVKKKNTRS
jgi:uncharacterized protein (DUF1778 family)